MRRFWLIALGAIALGLIVFALTACGGSATNPTTATKTNAPTSVLVATRPIQKGTLGSVIVSRGYYKVVKIPKSQDVSGVLHDPSALKGKVALRDVARGEQLTADQFGAANT